MLINNPTKFKLHIAVIFALMPNPKKSLLYPYPTITEPRWHAPKPQRNTSPPPPHNICCFQNPMKYIKTLIDIVPHKWRSCVQMMKEIQQWNSRTRELQINEKVDIDIVLCKWRTCVQRTEEIQEWNSQTRELQMNQKVGIDTVLCKRSCVRRKKIKTKNDSYNFQFFSFHFWI